MSQAVANALYAATVELVFSKCFVAERPLTKSLAPSAWCFAQKSASGETAEDAMREAY